MKELLNKVIALKNEQEQSHRGDLRDNNTYFYNLGKLDAYETIIKEMTQYDNKVFEAVSKLVGKEYNSLKESDALVRSAFKKLFKNLGYELSFSLIPLLSEGVIEAVFQKDNTIVYKYIYSDSKEKVFIDFIF